MNRCIDSTRRLPVTARPVFSGGIEKDGIASDVAKSSKWWSRNVARCCWFVAGATGSGCSRADASVAARARRPACAGRSGRASQAEARAAATLEGSQSPQSAFGSQDERCNLRGRQGLRSPDHRRQARDRQGHLAQTAWHPADADVALHQGQAVSEAPPLQGRGDGASLLAAADITIRLSSLLGNNRGCLVAGVLAGARMTRYSALMVGVLSVLAEPLSTSQISSAVGGGLRCSWTRSFPPFASQTKRETSKQSEV